MKAAVKKKPATPARVPAKTMSKTPKSTGKPAAKTGAKSAVKAKPAPKVAVKPAKPVAKSAKAAKPPARSAVKPAAKSSAKPVASSKSASAKPALKKAASAVKPEAKKSSGKSVTSAASKHAVAKPVPAKSGTSGKPAKPETKSVIKSSPKPSAKPESKSVASPAKSAAKPVTKPGAAVKVEKPAAAPAAVAAPAALQPGGLLPRPPLKPGRRSSARIASHSPPPAPMVPTHAPDAAKASYSTITERVIAPPPQAAAKKDPKLANNWKTKAGEALSDEEVKAMPDSEYMNEKQMAFFRHKLSVLKQDIHNSAGETTEHLREDTVVVPDPADRATIEEEHALELRTRDRERKLLKKIEQSIARIDSGDYGYCDETGEAIGVGRLIARPTANLSLEAQQRRELKQKMFGD
jgi:DnaK suppressor protein